MPSSVKRSPVAGRSRSRSLSSPLPPQPAAPPDEHENTVTNLNLASVDDSAPQDEGEVEIGEAEIDAEE